ncbi:MAG: type II toxin-antitoxin system Phd/YefM family antitoxin [Thiobacillus sp.]
MSTTTVTSRDFARDLAHAKKAANAGPVFITDRGCPAYALLRIEDYYRLAGIKPKSLLAIMDAIPGGNFEFEPPKLTGNDLTPADFN